MSIEPILENDVMLYLISLPKKLNIIIDFVGGSIHCKRNDLTCYDGYCQVFWKNGSVRIGYNKIVYIALNNKTEFPNIWALDQGIIKMY